MNNEERANAFATAVGDTKFHHGNISDWIEIHIGADFKGMKLSQNDQFVEFTMDSERDYTFIDKEEAEQIIEYLKKVFEI